MKYLIVFIGAAGVLLLFAILMAFPVKWLWNWLMPVIFMLPKITIWQALGINILCGLLFKNHGTNQK